jgi:hypothetical protein
MFGALQTPVGKSNEDINRSVTHLVSWGRFSFAILLFYMSKIRRWKRTCSFNWLQGFLKSLRNNSTLVYK